jgi:hypothetical protein
MPIPNSLMWVQTNVQKKGIGKKYKKGQNLKTQNSHNFLWERFKAHYNDIESA